MVPENGRRRHPASLPADKRRNIRFSETEVPLREDVHELGGQIGAMVRDRVGEELFNSVEAVRSLAIARRDGDARAHQRLVELLSSLDDRRAQDVSRAFATWFQAINTAEQLHRARRRHAYLYDASRPQRGGPEAIFRQLRKDGMDLRQAVEILNSIRLNPVFTGHPTEPTPTAVLRQQAGVAALLQELHRRSRPPRQVDALRRSMQEKLTAIWHCEEHPNEETTVAAELQQLLYFVAEVIYKACPDFYDSLIEAMTIVFGEEAREVEIASLLRFHSSIGGDLEADAEITPRSIRQLFDTKRLAVLNLYREECLALADALTHSGRRMEAGPDIRRRLRVYREHFPDVYGRLGSDERDMPYRALLRLMAARLKATALDTAFHYDDERGFLDDLQVLADSLSMHGGAFAGSRGVQRLARRVETFGFHLLAVEVRQRAALLRRVLGKARWAGFERGDGHAPLDLIPVFESNFDDRQCARVIGQLLSEPAYRRHIASRNKQQFVMVDHARARLDFDLPSEQWSIRALQKAAVGAIAGNQATAVLLQGRGSAYQRSGRRSLLAGIPRGMAEYFELATPADLLARMPTTVRRSGMREGTAVELPRALVSFCWAQSRNLLPGWYGFGSGLAQAIREHGLKAVRQAAQEWPYLHGMLRDLELALARSDLEIAERYSRLAGKLHEPCFRVILQEHERTLENLLRVFRRKALLEDQPALRRSIRLRNPYVDPMNLLQVRLLWRWRESGRECSGDLYSALKSTVYGIARGVQEAT